MKTETKNKIIKLVKDSKFAKHMEYLYSRWQDERKYEDWKEYEDSMKKQIEKVKLQFIKGNKRPFGCIVTDGESKITISLKFKGNNFSINAYVK